MNKKQLYETIMASVAKEVKKTLNEQSDCSDIIKDILYRFKERKGMGVTGASLDEIAEFTREKLGDDVLLRFNLPYHGFNARGKAKDVAEDTKNAMPYIGDYDKLEYATTFYYRDNFVAEPNKSFLPFLGDSDRYFINDYEDDGEYCIFNLIKGPSWRTYL